MDIDLQELAKKLVDEIVSRLSRGSGDEPQHDPAVVESEDISQDPMPDLPGEFPKTPKFSSLEPPWGKRPYVPSDVPPTLRHAQTAPAARATKATPASPVDTRSTRVKPVLDSPSVIASDSGSPIEFKATKPAARHDFFRVDQPPPAPPTIDVFRPNDPALRTVGVVPESHGPAPDFQEAPATITQPPVSLTANTLEPRRHSILADPIPGPSASSQPQESSSIAWERPPVDSLPDMGHAGIPPQQADLRWQRPETGQLEGPPASTPPATRLTASRTDQQAPVLPVGERVTVSAQQLDLDSQRPTPATDWPHAEARHQPENWNWPPRPMTDSPFPPHPEAHSAPPLTIGNHPLPMIDASGHPRRGFSHDDPTGVQQLGAEQTARTDSYDRSVAMLFESHVANNQLARHHRESENRLLSRMLKDLNDDYRRLDDLERGYECSRETITDINL